ncbi:MAG: CopG family transcriptional regulator [Desulfatiglans sp.]|jgi:metal-responsive CopG/Arc/MetJ family transcriptional regulator|nr:CopG family transcriptional regulator [Desulfatiglans sp.]
MKTKKTRIAMTISMPENIAEEYENLARLMSKNKSVLFREMFQVYKEQALEKEFRELQKYGADLGRAKGLFSEADIEKLVFQGR